ncbi:MAG: VWA domain-containing protein [Thiothrix sp.]|nr:VWA domain-containing protein [Thiothrix sp.]
MRMPGRYRSSLLLLLALLCMVLALLRPFWPLERKVWNYSFILDITQSMNTRDYRLNGTLTDRLTMARQAVRSALTQLPCGSRVGLGLYTANNTYQLFQPLEVCRHYAIIADVLTHIDWRMAWANDSQIQYGLYAALELMNESADPPALVFLTDGDQSPPADPAREPAFMGAPGQPGGFIIGTGNEIPTPVPHLAPDNSISGYWTREEALNNSGGLNAVQSHLYLSRLDQARLQRFAVITGLSYRHLQQPEQLGRWLLAPELATTRTISTDMRWLFGGLALVLVLLSGWPSPQRSNRQPAHLH